MALTHDERRFLLRLARSAIAAHLGGCPPPDHDISSGGLAEHRGAFVTLTIDGALRGCIGHVAGIEPLWMSVRSNAVSAAVRDPRFSPLSKEELDGTEIEISVMSPLREIRDPDSIEIGGHGLLIECGAARGLLLPQVAARYDWGTEEFLQNTCRKAGLGPSCWKNPDAKLFIFSVESFEEKTPGK